MKRFGFYCEHFAQSNLLSSVIEAERAAINPPGRMVAYLRESPTVVDVMESSDCLLGCGSFLAGGSSVKTDGEWVWRADFVHYVEVHDLAVPAEFLEWGNGGNWEIPSGILGNQSVAQDALACAWSLT